MAGERTGTYRAVRALNWSTLKHWRTSPAHGHEFETTAEERPDTLDLLLGRAFHVATLEPHTFADRYVVLTAARIAEIAPPFTSRDGKALRAAYIERHPEAEGGSADEHRAGMISEALDGRESLTEKQRDAALFMAQAVRRHPAAARYFPDGQIVGEVETVRQWREGETLCKARLDYVPFDAVIVDLKSALTIEAHPFTAKAWRLGYMHQAAFYRRGHAAAKGRARDGIEFALIGCEKVAPFDVGVFPLRTDTLDDCDAEIDELLARRAECNRRREWPGRYPEAVEIGAPAWALTGLDEGFEVVSEEGTDNG